MTNFFALFSREIFLNFRNIQNLIISISFFFIAIFVFMIALGPDVKILSETGYAIIWSILLFTILLGSEQFFIKDYLDGSFKELQIIGFSAEIIIFTKVIVMWIFLIMPLLFFIPIIAVMLSLKFEPVIILIISIILGSPSLLLITTVGILLTIQSNKSKILLLIIIFPFFIPILIYGIGTIKLYNLLLDPSANFLILFGIFLITLPVTIISGKYVFKEVNN